MLKPYLFKHASMLLDTILLLFFCFLVLANVDRKLNVFHPSICATGADYFSSSICFLACMCV